MATTIEKREKVRVSVDLLRKEQLRKEYSVMAQILLAFAFGKMDPETHNADFTAAEYFEFMEIPKRKKGTYCRERYEELRVLAKGLQRKVPYGIPGADYRFSPITDQSGFRYKNDVLPCGVPLEGLRNMMDALHAYWGAGEVRKIGWSPSRIEGARDLDLSGMKGSGWDKMQIQYDDQTATLWTIGEDPPDLHGSFLPRKDKNGKRIKPVGLRLHFSGDMVRMMKVYAPIKRKYVVAVRKSLDRDKWAQRAVFLWDLVTTRNKRGEGQAAYAKKASGLIDEHFPDAKSGRDRNRALKRIREWFQYAVDHDILDKMPDERGDSGDPTFCVEEIGSETKNTSDEKPSKE